jgi:diguanylate cyclase (GGDEF)-like protein
MKSMRSLQIKASSILCIMMLGLVTIGSSAFIRMTGNVLRESQADRCRNVASSLAVAAAESIAGQDRVNLTDLAHRLISEGDLLFVAFTDTSGQMLGERHLYPTMLERIHAFGPSGAWAASLATPIFVPETEAHPTYLQYHYPINLSESALDKDGGTVRIAPMEELVGYVHLGLGLSSVESALSAAHRRIYMIMALLIITVLPLSVLVAHWIISPVNQLASAARRFAKGDMGIRVHFDRNDEIGDLGEAFNGMANDLARSHDQLVKLNADLESRVLERTQQLKELASKDALTGLFNRRFFSESLNRQFSQAWRYGTDLSCLMIDLDDFKEINDHYGHKTGDEVLIGTASAITKQLRAADLGTRYGGDEFVILMPQTSGDDAYTVALRIQSAFEELIRTRFPEVKIGLSIGVASMRAVSSSNPDALVVAADRALYQAKKNGKNRIVAAAPAVLA